MHTKFKLRLIIILILLALAEATIINVSLNFVYRSIKRAVEKVTITAVVVKDGLTTHIVNDIMNKY
ncbi:MAG: hypothetical protein SPLUMA2_SPLUMAMAG2_01371 [uncultured Sulfurimonas sp.]|nr:MAG: hypothetical protein SPLUMA1_SPLUMAMAG1_01659 [uncultured Sulfurimonas sp.]CAI6167070.1 MAG: hypothetical protein SPLUMA2_SPLUMAMAG2_01371 [uncultured Sulfurimonas sp.]